MTAPASRSDPGASVIEPRAPVHRRHRGIATLWTVLTIILMVACIALAVDVGWVVLVGHQLGAGADAAALAGAMEVRRSSSGARDQAVALALANFAAGAAIQIERNDANAAGGDVVIGRFNRQTRTFTTTLAAGQFPNAVQVRARRIDGSAGGPVEAIFAPVFGVNAWDVQREAIAMIGGDVGPGVIALNPSAACALTIQGNADFIVHNGAVSINSNHPSSAVCAVGNAGDFVAGELYVTGGVPDNFADRTDYDGDIYTGVDPMPDPLAGLPEPNVPTQTRSVPGGGGPPSSSITLEPGYYASMEFGPRTYVMESGVYYVDGPLTIHGNTRVDGTAGVMIFVGPNGSVNMMGQGNGWLRLEPLDPLSYPNGPTIPTELADARVTFFQSRDNSTTMTFRGNNNWQVGGTVYAPAALMSVGGTPDTFSNGLIADRFETFGNGSIVVDYDNRFPVVPRFVFLVR